MGSAVDQVIFQRDCAVLDFHQQLSSSPVCFFTVFYFSHSNRCVLVSRCDFNVHFPNSY